jgi:tripartite-type tricarboxylate transporter receptor subunit TctC
MKRFITLILAIIMVTISAQTLAMTSDFPSKEIKLIVPFSAGGATDIMARQMQPLFKSLLDVTLVVEDVEGGGSVTGVTQALTSNPDGYTVGLVTSSYIALDVQGQVPIPLSDVELISSLSEDPLCIVVKHPKVGGEYTTAEDFLDDAKSRPGEVIIAQAGNNNANQACVTVLGEVAGIEFNNIPYDGASRVVTEIIGGHIEAGCMKPADCLSQLQAEEVMIIGTFTPERVNILPDVPTFVEMGYDVFKYGDIAMITFIAAPSGISQDVKSKLEEMFKTVLSSKEWQAVAEERAFVSNPISGQELIDYVNSVYGSLKVISEKILNNN